LPQAGFYSTVGTQITMHITLKDSLTSGRTVTARRAFGALVTLAACCGGTAYAQDFTVAIESASTFEVERVLVAPAGSERWQVASLQGLEPSDPTIVAGGSGEIAFPAPSGICAFDMKFVMDSDVEFYDHGVDLCQAQLYTLTDRFE